ncbi:MAG: hypothetical protein ACTHME_04590 [Candidatus Nitrosocosmicus sp.]
MPESKPIGPVIHTGSNILLYSIPEEIKIILQSNDLRINKSRSD